MAKYLVNLNIGRTDIRAGEILSDAQLKHRTTEQIDDLCKRGILTCVEKDTPAEPKRKRGRPAASSYRQTVTEPTDKE